MKEKPSQFRPITWSKSIKRGDTQFVDLLKTRKHASAVYPSNDKGISKKNPIIFDSELHDGMYIVYRHKQSESNTSSRGRTATLRKYIANKRKDDINALSDLFTSVFNF